MVLFFVLRDKKRRWQSGWQRRWTVVTEQEGQRRRKDRAGWEGVGGVGWGWGLRNWKKEDRSWCSLGLGHLFALKGQTSIIPEQWRGLSIQIGKIVMWLWHNSQWKKLAISVLEITNWLDYFQHFWRQNKLCECSKNDIRWPNFGLIVKLVALEKCSHAETINSLDWRLLQAVADGLSVTNRSLMDGRLVQIHLQILL